LKMTDGKNNCHCVQGVGCDVYNCKYNEQTCGTCMASHITVQNKSALNKAETFCDTFTPRGSF